LVKPAIGTRFVFRHRSAAPMAANFARADWRGGRGIWKCRRLLSRCWRLRGEKRVELTEAKMQTGTTKQDEGEAEKEDESFAESDWLAILSLGKGGSRWQIMIIC